MMKNAGKLGLFGWDLLEETHRMLRAIVLGIVVAVAVIAGASLVAGCQATPDRAAERMLSITVQDALSDGVLTEAEAQAIASALAGLHVGDTQLPEWVTVIGSIVAAAGTAFLGVGVASKRAAARTIKASRTNQPKTQED